MEQLSGHRSNTTLWQSASNTSELRCFDCSGRGTRNNQGDGERCTSSLHDVDRTNVKQCLIFFFFDLGRCGRRRDYKAQPCHETARYGTVSPAYSHCGRAGHMQRGLINRLDPELAQTPSSFAGVFVSIERTLRLTPSPCICMERITVVQLGRRPHPLAAHVCLRRYDGRQMNA